MSHASPQKLDRDAATGAAGLQAAGPALPDAATESAHGQSADKAVRGASAGRAAFAATMAALGILGAVQGDFTPIWLPVPKAVPAREALVYLSAIVALVGGLGLLWRRVAAGAAGALLGFLLAWLLLVDAPQLALHPGMGLVWAVGKTAALVAAAWVAYVWFAGRRDGLRGRLGAGTRGLRVARALYGLALIPFGIAHFTYFARTISMVPGWLPWHAAWAVFFGCTFIAAGIAMLLGVYAGLAAALSVLQLAMFTLLVWVPVLIRGASAADWREFVVSWTLTTAAWVVADSYRAGTGETRAR